MQQLEEYSDERLRGAWVVCTEDHDDPRRSRDHVPTRALLDCPYPDNLPVVYMCRECNSGYTRDEAYFAAFLSTVISGSSALAVRGRSGVDRQSAVGL